MSLLFRELFIIECKIVIKFFIELIQSPFFGKKLLNLLIANIDQLVDNFFFLEHIAESLLDLLPLVTHEEREFLQVGSGVSDVVKLFDLLNDLWDIILLQQ